MNVRDFLLALQKKELEPYSVVCFVGDSYSILFFMMLRDIVSKASDYPLQTIELEGLDYKYQALFEISFLGNTILYWAGNIHAISLDERKRFISYVKFYRGPHRIWFFANQWQEEIDKNMVIVSLKENAEELADQIAVLLMKFLKKDISPIQSLIKKERWALEQTCLFLQYYTVLGKSQIPEFMEKWVDKIIVPEKSLFTLSGYFFSKNKYSFFENWYKIKSDFGIFFWISFWSDQLFRAANFIVLMRANMHIEAKKISYKLPFSFIKKDWTKTTASEMSSAHNALYLLDYSLKNAGSEDFFTLFFINFFENKFISKE